MRRSLLLILGLGEVALALALFSLGWHVPGRSQVENTFAQAHHISQNIETRLNRLRQRLRELRQPEVQQLASRLQLQLRTVNNVLRDQTVDFATVASLRDALGQVAEGLEEGGASLDPSVLNKLGEGLGSVAGFLDEKLIPAAGEAAQHLEQATKLLGHDARTLAEFFKSNPTDLKVVRELHASLDKFSAGMGKLAQSLEVQRFQVMREGFQGMHQAVSVAADNVERLANYTYPVLTLDGLRPEVEQRPFWPSGEKIAAGLRKASKGVTAADQELATLAKSLPELRSSLEASRAVLDATRAALGTALEHQHQVEGILKELPAQTTRLAELLPKISQALARVLRDSSRFNQVATSLRQSRQQLEATVQRWPAIRKGISGTATLLQTARQQLDRALQNRDEYEKAQAQTAALVEAFAGALPELTEQTTIHLREEERSLEELGRSVQELGSALPGYGTAAGQVVLLVTVLLWLLAGLLGIHGGWLLGSRPLTMHPPRRSEHVREDSDPLRSGD